MIWHVPRMWEGGECWIIGGGPSMSRQFGVPEDVILKVRSGLLPPSTYSSYLAPIHQKHVIGINSAFLIGDWIDMVFFGDKRWFFDYRNRLAEFPGLKVSCHSHLGSDKYRSEHIKYLPRNKRRGISDNARSVSWNANSGAAAISVAVWAGAVRIILLGFDMKLDDSGKQHWHGLYKNPKGTKPRSPKNLPFDRHLVGFPIIAKEAQKRKVEILNACPDSAIECFKKVTVKELLK